MILMMIGSLSKNLLGLRIPPVAVRQKRTSLPPKEEREEERAEEQGEAGEELEVEADKKKSEASLSSEGRWSDTTEPDIIPPRPIFRPSRTPGFQLISTVTYSCVELFQMFLTTSTILTILANTNQHGRSHFSTEEKPWTEITMQDFLKNFVSGFVHGLCQVFILDRLLAP